MHILNFLRETIEKFLYVICAAIAKKNFQVFDGYFFFRRLSFLDCHEPQTVPAHRLCLLVFANS